MNGYDLQKWNIVLEKMEKMGIHYEISGDIIDILVKSLIPQKESYESLGYFNDINSLYDYICGYEVGFYRGKNYKTKG